MNFNIIKRIFHKDEYLEYDIANKRINEEKPPRQIHTVYLCLYNDVYNEYIRKYHFFKKDEWIYVRTLSEDKLKHEIRRYECLCCTPFDKHYKIIK